MSDELFKAEGFRDLMPDWKISDCGRITWPHELYDEQLNPYESAAQFGLIFLRYPKVMEQFCMVFQEDGVQWVKLNIYRSEPTQSEILDEILRMNGVEI